jgi:hypothetical protein
VIQDHVNRRTVSEKKERAVAPNSNRIIAKAVPLDDQQGFLVSAQRSDRCDLTSILQVRSVRHIRREPDWSSALLWLGAGALTGGLGAWVLVDASNVPQSGDLHNRNPVGRSGAYGIGAGLSIAGGAAVIAGIATFIRGTDSRENLGTKPVRGERVEVACNTSSADNVQVEMAPVVAGLPRPPVTLGNTSLDGKLRISKRELRSLLESAPGAEKAQLRFEKSVLDIDLGATKVAMASAAIETAISLAKADHVDEAKIELNFAAELGGDIGSAQKALDDAPTTRRQLAEAKQKAEADRAAAEKEKAREIDGHVARARQLIRTSDLEKAQAELDLAKALGADVGPLADKITRIVAARTVAKWRNHVARCRKVSAVRSKIESISQCDADCQVIKRRVEKDWERLGEEKLDLDGIPAEQSQAFTDMCQQAGCPNCPN